MAKIDAKLSGNKKASSKAKAKLRYIKNNLEKYLDQETVLGERNSYSKTDTEATFMRMKEDHMKNGH